MNKKIKIIFFVGFVMFVLGIIFYFIFPTFNNNKDNDSKKEPDTNKITKFEEERCLENICISSMTITVKDGNSYINGTIENKSNIDVASKFIDLDFILKDGREVLHSYQHSSLQANEKSPFTISIPIDYMTLATDYSIKESSEELLDEYNSNTIEGE